MCAMQHYSEVRVAVNELVRDVDLTRREALDSTLSKRLKSVDGERLNTLEPYSIQGRIPLCRDSSSAENVKDRRKSKLYVGEEEKKSI